MLLRSDPEGVLAIGQASHAWVSGQLARAWGNARFGPVEPREEVCLAAEQHDVGMAAWDLTPTRNHHTGLPHSFMEMPVETHLELWRAGPPRLLSQSRYAALLASLHGYRLYEHRDLDRLTHDQVDAVRAFLSDQRAWQGQLLESLRGDPATAAAAAPERVRHNSDLIWTWDFLALALCLEWAPCAAREVPSSEGPIAIQIATGDAPLEFSFDPWPFTNPDEVVVRCEGRRLQRGFGTDQQLGEALAGAGWETLDFRLVPAGR